MDKIKENFLKELFYGLSEELIADGQVKASLVGYYGDKAYDDYRPGGKYSRENHPVDKKLLYKACLDNQLGVQRAEEFSGYTEKKYEYAVRWVYDNTVGCNMGERRDWAENIVKEVGDKAKLVRREVGEWEEVK